MPRRTSSFGKNGRYVLRGKLGEGAFAKVRLADDYGEGRSQNTASPSRGGAVVRRVAVKIINTKALTFSEERFRAVKREIAIMRSLRHENLVQLLDLVQTQRKVYIVMELCEGGELFEVLAREKRFEEARARNYFQQLIRAVEYCHRAGVCHRDLKPENLLLSKNRATVKVTDFGLSQVYSSPDSEGVNVLRNPCGTPQYAAPELMGERGYDGDAADVWSAGIVLYVLVAGFVPFDDDDEDTLHAKVRAGELKFPRWFSVELRALLKKILVVNPDERATIDVIKTDPWFLMTEFVDDNPPKKLSLRELDALTDVPSDESSEEEDEHLHVEGLRISNAFELIALSGVFDLSPVMQQDTMASEGRVRRDTSFTSPRSPKRILRRLEEVLEALPLGYRIFERAYKIRLRAQATVGVPLSCTIRIYGLASKLYVVEFVKKQGDFLEFNRLFRAIRLRCQDLVEPSECESEGSSSEDVFLNI